MQKITLFICQFIICILNMVLYSIIIDPNNINTIAVMSITFFWILCYILVGYIWIIKNSNIKEIHIALLIGTLTLNVSSILVYFKYDIFASIFLVYPFYFISSFIAMVTKCEVLTFIVLSLIPATCVEIGMLINMFINRIKNH